VNTSTPYDQLMAAKLDQVPVPDMADSIWTAIDTQLGAPAGVPPQKRVKTFNHKSWYGFLGTMTAITLLWWGYKHMHHTPSNKPPQKIQPATKDSPVIADSNTISYPVKKRNSHDKPATVKDPMPFQNIPNNGAVTDSTFKQDLPPVHPDTSLLRTNSVPLRHVDSVSVNAPPGKKKPKGVKGITNDDYKISVSNDSTRKEN